ncbi:MAG: pseudaminic acid synthase [Helicobacter sp.]|nr:pseudaminic acid synthase [Helicobacter sp.]
MKNLVAEISANHNNSLEIAIKTIKAAKEALANSVKIQTYTPDCLTLPVRSEIFKIKNTELWDERYLHDIYKEGALPFAWHRDLFNAARDIDIVLFSSPFSLNALDLLESLDCPMYKIASFEILDCEFIYSVASTKKPMILSTGIAIKSEIEEALDACISAGCKDITLLLCTSSYPAPIKLANINRLKSLSDLGKNKNKNVNIKVGLSDHTTSNLCAIMATTLGAQMIEKHFILDKSLGGLDASFSLDPIEFKQLALDIKNATLALGESALQESEDIKIKGRNFGRSLFIKAPIKKGEFLTRENIGSFRPNAGLHPRFLKEAIGKRATKDLDFGKPLFRDDFI